MFPTFITDVIATIRLAEMSKAIEAVAIQDYSSDEGWSFSKGDRVVVFDVSNDLAKGVPLPSNASFWVGHNGNASYPHQCEANNIANNTNNRDASAVGGHGNNNNQLTGNGGHAYNNPLPVLPASKIPRRVVNIPISVLHIHDNQGKWSYARSFRHSTPSSISYNKTTVAA